MLRFFSFAAPFVVFAGLALGATPQTITAPFATVISPTFPVDLPVPADPFLTDPGVDLPSPLYYDCIPVYPPAPITVWNVQLLSESIFSLKDEPER